MGRSRPRAERPDRTGAGRDAGAGQRPAYPDRRLPRDAGPDAAARRGPRVCPAAAPARSALRRRLRAGGAGMGRALASTAGPAGRHPGRARLGLARPLRAAADQLALAGDRIFLPGGPERGRTLRRTASARDRRTDRAALPVGAQHPAGTGECSRAAARAAGCAVRCWPRPLARRRPAAAARRPRRAAARPGSALAGRSRCRPACRAARGGAAAPARGLAHRRPGP